MGDFPTHQGLTVAGEHKQGAVNPLKAICSYCGYTYRNGIEPPSHGVCDICAPVIKAALKAGQSEVQACRVDAVRHSGMTKRMVMMRLAMRPKVDPAKLVESEVFRGFMGQD
jgi:hypothetical protein